MAMMNRKTLFTGFDRMGQPVTIIPPLKIKFRVQSSEFKVQSSKFRVQSSEFRV
jgi:hypothetical protein